MKFEWSTPNLESTPNRYVFTAIQVGLLYSGQVTTTGFALSLIYKHNFGCWVKSLDIIHKTR